MSSPDWSGVPKKYRLLVFNTLHAKVNEYEGKAREYALDSDTRTREKDFSQSWQRVAEAFRAQAAAYRAALQALRGIK